MLTEDQHQREVDRHYPKLIMLSPDHKIAAHSIGKSSKEFCRSAESILAQEPVKHKSCKKDLKDHHPHNKKKHMGGSLHKSQKIKDPDERVEHIIVKNIDSQSIGKIPVCKGSVFQMVYHICILHGILLPGVSANVIEHQHPVTKNIISEYKKAGCQQCHKKHCYHQPLPFYLFFIFYHTISFSGRNPGSPGLNSGCSKDLRFSGYPASVSP